MTDIHTKAQRSRNMAAIKGHGNRSTELKLVRFFKLYKIKGWQRHQSRLVGKPDFIFLSSKVAVFLDGCFWHGCKKHYIVPKTNKKFWSNKIRNNINRDKKVNKHYKLKRWRVIRIWEHDVKTNPAKVLNKISLALK